MGLPGPMFSKTAALPVLPMARSSHARGEADGRGSGRKCGHIVMFIVQPCTEVAAWQEGDGAKTTHGQVCVAMLEHTTDGGEGVEAGETVEEDDEEGEAGRPGSPSEKSSRVSWPLGEV
ncbi:unnamed protein product [Ectocarpus sp. 4 AP-2014]